MSSASLCFNKSWFCFCIGKFPSWLESRLNGCLSTLQCLTHANVDLPAAEGLRLSLFYIWIQFLPESFTVAMENTKQKSVRNCAPIFFFFLNKFSPNGFYGWLLDRGLSKVLSYLSHRTRSHHPNLSSPPSSTDNSRTCSHQLFSNPNETKCQ